MTDSTGGAPPQVRYDLLHPSFFADPYPLLHRMRAEEPVHWHPLLNFWVLTRHDDIQLLMRDPRFSAERADQLGTGVSAAMLPKLQVCLELVSHFMVLRDPPRHTVLRGLVAKAFSPQMIDALRPSIKSIVDEMLDRVEGGGSMDIVRDLAFPLPAMVIATMLGVPRERTDEFKAWTTDLFSLLGAGVATDAAVEAGHRGAVALRQCFRDLIAARRATPTEDLLSKLIAAEEQGAVLSEDEVIATSALLLIAGHETTTHLIGNAVLALLRNPSELVKLRDDPGLMDGAIEELLRYDGAAMMISRRALADLEIGGVKIRSGEIVAGFLPAANRDPSAFPEPDRLDVTRRGVKSLAFGHGIHYCIGAALARVEASVAISEILRRLPGLHLATESLEWIPGIVIRGLTALPVTFGRQAEERASDGGQRGWDGPVSIRAPLSMRAPVAVPAPPVSQRWPRA